MATVDDGDKTAIAEFIPVEDLEAEFNSVLTNFKTELQKARARCNTQQDEIIKLKTKLKQAVQRHSRKEHFLRNMNEENKTHIEELNNLIKSMNTKLKEINCEHSKETEQLKFELNEANHFLTSKINEEKIKTTEIEYRMHTFEEENATFCELVKSLNAEVTTLKSEKEQLQSQISKLAGAKLMHNNPNIADLIDGKRPTKLAEEFSELYDNEWTDAFEDVDISDEKTKSRFLLELLQLANQLCHHVSTEHRENVQQSLSTLTISLPDAAPPETQKSDENSTDTTPNYKLKEKGKVETIQTLDAAVQTSEKNQTNGSDNNKTLILASDFRLLQKEQTKTIMDARNFFEIKLTEEMVKAGTDIVVQENGIDAQKQESIVAYIEKCINICWSMYRHDQPVYVEIMNVTENTPFDTNKFKPYTKSGKYIEYIVWPALHLHEGGPLLSKGVAQGRKA